MESPINEARPPRRLRRRGTESDRKRIRILSGHLIQHGSATTQAAWRGPAYTNALSRTITYDFSRGGRRGDPAAEGGDHQRVVAAEGLLIGGEEHKQDQGDGD